MRKINVSWVVVGVAFCLVFMLGFQMNSAKKRMIEKDYEIILKANCELSLEVNNLILSEVWSDTQLRKKHLIKKHLIKKHLIKLLDIIYESSRRGSNYEIKDQIYLDTFGRLNYFEEYAYNIKLLLEKTTLTMEDRKYLEEITKETEHLLETMDSSRQFQ